MNFEGTFEIETPIDKVFEFVLIPESLSSCIPGLKSMERHSDEEFTVLVKVGIAFIKEDFTINFRVAEKTVPSHAKLSGNGSGKSGTIAIDATMDLSGFNGKTTMKWKADAVVGGKIGSVGQRMINGQAEKIITQMFDGIRKALTS